jgi:hypothetical protein
VLACGFEAFLDAILESDIQRILILDGPAVLGLARFTELDERYAFAVIDAGFGPPPKPAHFESTIQRPSPDCCSVR